MMNTTTKFFFRVLLTAALVALCTSSSIPVSAYIDLNFDVFTQLQNRSAPFGGDTWDTSSNRLDPQFKYTAIALVEGQAPFSVERFKQRVLSALPAKWKHLHADYVQFERNFMVLEYCSWPEWKATCAEMRTGQQSVWRNFAATRFSAPVCRDDRGGTSGRWEMLPLLTTGPLANWTLVRFTFAGADRVEYVESLILDDHENQALQLGLCDLGKGDDPWTGRTQEYYTFYADAANPFEKTIVPRGTKLPSKIQDVVSKWKRYITKEPGTSSAIGAIVALIIIFCLAFCLIKVMSARKQINEAKDRFSAAMEQRQAPPHDASRASAYAVTDDDDGAAGGGGSAASGGVRRQAAQPQDEYGDAVDEMAERIRRMAARRKEMDAAKEGAAAASSDGTSVVDSKTDSDRHTGSGSSGPFPAEHELEKVAPAGKNDDDDDNEQGKASAVTNIFSPSSADNRPVMLAPPRDEAAESGFH